MDRPLGRAQECDRLEEIAQTARQGRSGVLVLRGEPGVGKTALLDYLQAAAADFQVARIDGVESEMELSFAALHQLLRPSLDHVGALPPPQRDALRLAVGLQDGGPPDRFLVGLAALGLLADRAGRQPLLCIIDDAHCLDQESADALSFAARRLDADSIAMAFAVREPAPRSRVLNGLNGLPELRLAGLDPAAAGKLLATAAGPRLDAAVSARIVAQARGNPLALTEIGQALAPEQLSGVWPLPEPVPIGRQLERRYLEEIRGLPDDTRALLLTAAADPTGDPVLLWRAGRELGFTAEVAGAAEARQLIAIRDAVRFRHPLIRSAVYYGAPLARRQRVHAALAAATDAAAEPDLRAWHRAQAASGPDEDVAADLERAGDRAGRRGGWTAAEALYKRAATLSDDPAARGRRLLAAAAASCSGGTPGPAQLVLDEAAAYRGDVRYHALVQRVQGRIYHARRRPAEATAALLAAAAELGPSDIRLARDILVEAIVQAQISGQLAPGGTTRGDVGRAARSLPLPPGMPPTPGDLLLDADMTLQLQGLAAAAPQLRTAIDAVRGAPARSPEIFQWLAAACADATILADDGGLHELAWRMEALAREQGAAPALSLALSHAGVSELLAGLLPEAERCFLERAATEEARGNDWSIGALLICAWRGQARPAYALLDTVSAEAGRQGQGYQLVFADYARCILELGLGRYDRAYASLAAGIEDTSQIKFALPDLVEAAQRCGETGGARRLTGRLAELARASPVPATLGFLARARAFIAADAAQAQDHYQDAIEYHRRTRGPAHLARSQLVYGEWLRRAKRPRDAREQLRAAYQLFGEMGAGGFAARARLELLAAGETMPPEAAGGDHHQFTPQEARVARLAAAGATNAEIAGQLYLSANTVDYHLRKVFRKLGVSSRRELAAHLR